MASTNKIKSDIEEFIYLNKIGTTKQDFIDFRKNLISGLGDDIFLYKDRTQLLFNILKQVFPINKTLELDNNSIEEACSKILDHFKLNKNVTVSVRDKKGWKKIKSKKEDRTTRFCKHANHFNY